MKKTHSVNVDKIPDDYKCLVKPEMTNDEIATLGNVIIRMKYERLKNRLFGWYYEKKLKGKSKGNI